MYLRPPRWDRYGYILAVVSVAVATAIFLPGRDFFATGQWPLIYLLLVVLIAGVSGVRAAIVAALLSFLAWNFFFLHPYYTFSIHDPKDLLSLFIFLIVGLIMGVQTGRMHQREEEAVARERETSLLNRISASLVSVASTRTMAEVLLNGLATVTGAARATLLLADNAGQLVTAYTLPAHRETEEEVQRFAEWVYRQNKAVGLPSVTSLTQLGVESWPVSVKAREVMPCDSCLDIYLPLQSATQMEGVLHIGGRADGQPYSAHDARLFVSIANLAAGFLERQRLETAASHATALHEADQLKNTLISSVSHELKTPLAAVTAAVSSLRGEDVSWEPAEVRQELASIEQDLLRLNDSITALLDLSRLKADAWKPEKDWYEIGEVVGTALSTLTPEERKRIHLAIPVDLPVVYVDFQQLARAIQHLLENALVYAPPATPVNIGAAATAREVRLWVEDTGPGIPAAERERIFEQFYRGAEAERMPSGTGLGLAITLEIIRYQGGRIWVEDVQPHGARFVIALPIGPDGEGNTP